MNRRLGELTGFRLAPIEGLVETRGFLSWLEHRTMLCTQYIRHTSRPEYTPEPDIVHEAIGHIPNFTNPAFADFSQFIGHGAKIATDEQLEELQAQRASSFYLDAKSKLGISTERIPQLSEMNKRLKELCNFRLAPIEGLVETRAFLSWLSYRTMLCTQYIRHPSRPEYTPEPDIVHEAIGHIPNFTNCDFADFSQFIGHGARVATDEQLEELGRLYWFTVEYGLVEENGELKAYGAGLLSSFGELENAFTDHVERRPFDLKQVINTSYSYSDMQPILYVIPSYAYLKETTRKYIESFSKK
jgi:phenylalanine-4-hydroxylase